MASEIASGSIPIWVLVPITVLVVAILSSYFSRLRRSLFYRKLPPGPFCWPVIGYLPVLDPGSSHSALRKLSQKYGKVVSLNVGDRLVVVLNDFSTIKESYNQEEFMGRPEGTLQIQPDQTSMIEIDGPEWKEQRRFTMGILRLLGVGDPSFESLVKSLVADVITTLRNQEGQDINVCHIVELALNNVTFQLIYGKTFDNDHLMIRFLSDFDDALQVRLRIQGTRTFFPWLGFVLYLLAKLGTTNQTIKKMDDIIRKEIEEHRMTLDENEPRDFIDYFLMKIKETRQDNFYTISSLLGNAKLMIVASSETSRLTLSWFLLLMAAHPIEQAKVHAEIDAILGPDKEPCYGDRVRMPYTSAAILEGMRLKNIINLNLIRRTTADTTLCGFNIPKDTLILHNMTSQFHDSDFWERPDDFDPNRFLSKDGLKVIVPEHYIPFSFGRRNCVGEKWAQIQNFLFTVSLLQNFRILPPEGGVNLEVKTVFNNSQVYPYARFQCRH